jgi:Leucine-rich repeat (LRR) protein
VTQVLDSTFCNKTGVEISVCDGKFDGITETKNAVVGSLNGEQTENAYVNGVYINEQVAHYLPLGLFKFFPFMYELYIFRSNLTHINQNDFKGYTGLTTISLSRNNLSNIPFDTFDEMVNLRRFSLSFNKLKTIPNLKKLTKLQELYLFENQLETFTVEDIQANTELKVIWIYENKLKHIDGQIFIVLNKLRSAYLTKNACIDKFFTLIEDSEREGIKDEVNEKCNSLQSA